MSRKKKIITLVALALIVLLVLAVPLLGRRYLVLRDFDTNRVLLCQPVVNGEEFSLEFTHSVNRTPVRDGYEIRDGRIYNTSCIYYDFGTGVQTELAEGESLSYEDGAMIISGINKDTTDMIIGIPQGSTHVLRIGGREVLLAGEFDRDVKLSFACSRMPFWPEA